MTYEGVTYLSLQNYVNTVQRPGSRVSWPWQFLHQHSAALWVKDEFALAKTAHESAATKQICI
jgi:hypothetical protein